MTRSDWFFIQKNVIKGTYTDSNKISACSLCYKWIESALDLVFTKFLSDRYISRIT